MAKDIEQKTPKFKFYVSNIAIWWNKGIEAKPSFSWFVKNIDWEEITDTESFTVSWVDETHIKVIIPLSKRNHLIRIEDLNLATNQYYFLVEELNRTNKNIEAIFQLDIWSSYIMSGEHLSEIRTTKNLDINQVSRYVPIGKQGVPTGEWVKEEVSINFGGETPYPLYNAANQPQGRDTLFYPNTPNIPGFELSYEWNWNKYHVFKTKKTNWTDTSYDNYILIPEGAKGRPIGGIELPSSKEYMFCEAILNAQGVGIIQQTMIINSEVVIDKVIEKSKSLPTSGLGDYIGSWIGPNFFRFKPRRQEFKWDKNGKKQRIVTSNLIFLGGSNVWGDILGLGLGDQTIYRLTDTTIKVGEGQFKPIDKERTYSLFGIIVNEKEIETYGINVRRESFSQGLSYLMNENNHLYNSKLFFNQKFIMANEKDSSEINIQAPNSYDDYSNQLANQRNTLITGQRANVANFVLNSAQSFIGGMTAGGGSLAGGVGASLLGFLKSAVQFQTTRNRYEAYLKDLRTQVSNTYTNYTDNFVFEKQYTPTFLHTIFDSNFLNKFGKEVLAGYKINPSKLTQFYGYEDIPRVVTKDYYNNNDCYIKIDELTKLDLDLHLTKRFTPIIKEGIITLLNNGVRVVNNPTELDIN